MSDSEDPLDAIDEGGDDLFGDDLEEQEEVASPQARLADDDDLGIASDADDDVEDRHLYYEDSQTHRETKESVVMAVPTYRHKIPKPEDGTLRVMRVPKFLKLHPELYDPDTFEPSDFDLANAVDEHSKHVIRVRMDHETHELKSNANIYRWSDGSVTIAVGGEQYEIIKKPLAPAAGQPYNELHDAHYYAAAAELGSNLLMTVGHITEQYNVRPSKAVGDNALTILAERMALASRASTNNDMIIKTTRDPELQKKQAEMAEKERIKAQRRRENAAAKMDGGAARGGRGGLSIGDLEGGRRAGGASRKRGAPGSGRLKRRRPEYDSDDDLPQGAKRHEEYDLDDGFLVASDEEEEEGEEDGEEEEEEEEEEEDVLDDEEAPRSKRQRTNEAASDEDAEGDEVEPAEASGRSRRRNVIEDDEE